MMGNFVIAGLDFTFGAEKPQGGTLRFSFPIQSPFFATRASMRENESSVFSSFYSLKC